MGTTRTALRDPDGGPELAYVLVIEGYQYLITDGNASDAITAWAGSLWSNALPGLQVSGSFSQSLAPWSNELEVTHFTFAVMPEETDQFGIDMFKSKASVRSELTVGFDTGDSAGGGFNINVKAATGFATGNPVYIGNEAFNVTGAPSGTTIPVAESGYWNPFSTSGGASNAFPGKHSIADGNSVGAYGAVSPVYVTDSPETWIGKKVALYIHRVVAGVWDLKAEAELAFAGTISSVGEHGLMTVVECEGVQKQILDATLMQDQWTGRVKKGYTFTDGDFVQVSYYKHSSSSGAVSASFTAATGAAADEFETDTYTAEEFGALLAEHLDGDSLIGKGSGFALRWTSTVFSSSSGQRFQLLGISSVSVDATISIVASDVMILKFLGFDAAISGSADGLAYAGGLTVFSGTDTPLVSDSAPYSFPPIGSLGTGGTSVSTIEFESADGAFFDHTDLLPQFAREYVTSGEAWSFFSVDDKVVFLGKSDSATAPTKITNIVTGIGPRGITDGEAVSAGGFRVGEGEMRVKQLFFGVGTLCDIITKLFASIDGQGSNHATYDVLPWGASIPWSLLGQNFLDSLASLEQSGVEDSIVLLVEKPTRLWDAIKSDLALRMAHPIWKDGGLIIAQLTVPNASTSDHTLDETSKSDDERTSPDLTGSYLATTLKIEHSRNPMTDKYLDVTIARDVTAYESAGGGGPTKTVRARNSYGGISATGASVEALADMITARFLPVFSKPLKVFTRSIPHTLFHMAPGDTVTFSDDFIRSPDTGVRGVTNRAGTIIGVRSSLGISSGGQGYFGECDVLYTEEDRLFPLAPSLEHADGITWSGVSGRDWTSGYDDEVGTAGVFSMLVQRRAFSTSPDAVDSTHFLAGDEIRITEIDPVDPAAADSFTDVIASIATSIFTVYDEIVLTTGFGNSGNPAFDADKTYVVNFDSYSAVGAAQQLVAYQADDVDGAILDSATPNLVGDVVKYNVASVDLTELPSKHANEQFGDGEPLSASFMRDLIRKANNLANHKTAVSNPTLAASLAIVSTAGPSEFRHLWTLPMYIGDEQWPGLLKRAIKAAPFWQSGGGTVTIKITSSANPPKGAYLDTTFHGPSNTIEFTTTTMTLHTNAIQDLDVVRSESWPGFTWITVEGNNSVGFQGLTALELAALA